MSKLTKEIEKALWSATPGPWREFEIEYVKEDDGTYRRIESGRGYIKEGKGFGITGYITPEDSQLIANAPTWLSQLLEERKQMVEAFEYILEYWNRDENEKAMSDALWKIIEISEETLSKVGESDE